VPRACFVGRINAEILNEDLLYSMFMAAVKRTEHILEPGD